MSTASSRREARRRCRPVTSVVSALWGFVANGHQAVRHVSSDPSKIPYGGFSPVRLQTGTVRRHLRRLRRLIGGLKRRRPPDLVVPALSRGQGQTRRHVPVQRPLARRRVMLSRRVIAYYGLIRASGTLRTAYLFRRPVFASRPRARRSLLSACESFRPCRLPYPGRPGGPGRLYVRP
jgi:hypothetical protein